MDPDSIQPILFMVVLVIFSGYFSATETAFSTFNRIRLKNLAEDGNKRAKLVLELSENYDRLLSTILVGNNIVNILLTAIATVFFTGIYGEGVGPTVSTVVSTIVVLLFGEISPKSLAKEHAEAFTMATAPILRCIIVILYPINWVFGLWKKLLKVLFKSSDDQGVTEEELLTIVDEAEQDGALGEDESDLIRRAISFNDREAVDIIIPRVDVTGVPVNASYEDMRAIFAQTRFSRLPVYDGTMDNIVGVVHLKDCTLGETMPTPTDILKPAVFVPPTMPLRVLLKMLQDEKCHIAIVADEYGGTLGIVTLEDILEEIVGEIWDEHDDVVENIRLVGDNRYAVLCTTELREMLEYFDRETECESATVGGWVMETLGHIPASGEKFTADGLDVTVIETENNHPEEIMVTPIEQDDEQDEK
ncbi:MAG: HlyC/CorC family transporter [Clostridia bacterium]|nr:HlyC/CorC family transporter [Clostridia bacterium]